MPGDAARLAAAARSDGAVNTEAEGYKRARYPAEACPWRLVPLAHETYGRLGTAALKHLRLLARTEASGDRERSKWEAHALQARWASRLSVALHAANARCARSALGAAGAAAARWRQRDVDFGA